MNKNKNKNNKNHDTPLIYFRHCFAAACLTCRHYITTLDYDIFTPYTPLLLHTFLYLRCFMLPFLRYFISSFLRRLMTCRHIFIDAAMTFTIFSFRHALRCLHLHHFHFSSCCFIISAIFFFISSSFISSLFSSSLHAYFSSSDTSSATYI